MTVEIELTALADSFAGRLPDSIIEDVKEYVDFREWGVAFNLLCEQLYEFDIAISESEWEQIENIGKALKLEDYSWIELKELLEPGV